MAKARPSSSPLDQIRSLLTAAERNVLHSSMGETIAKATREQVEAAMKRARTLRDKWRDLHASQTRTTKRAPKANAANERTRAKHDVFDGAVKRLEARLAELAGGIKAAVGRQAARLGAAKPSKAARTKAARGGRKQVRSELKSAVADMNRPPRQPEVTKPAATKPAATKPAAKPAAVKPASGRPAAATPAPRAGVRAGKRAAKKPVAPRAAVAQPKVAFDVSKQRSAKASAKAARLKFDGATTRRAGNALAATKRAQARRDGRRR